MKKVDLFTAILLGVEVALPAAAVQGRDAITTTQIATAISGTGMLVSAGQITLLSDVMATTKTPALKVQSMENWGVRGMKVRLMCSDSAECLPFFVAVRSDDVKSRVALSDQNRGSSSVAQAKRDPKTFVVRSGTPVRLLIDGDRVHIQLAAVCLENGAPGQTIRVASKDRKQTYLAEVVDGSLLRGHL